MSRRQFNRLAGGFEQQSRRMFLEREKTMDFATIDGAISNICVEETRKTSIRQFFFVGNLQNTTFPHALSPMLQFSQVVEVASYLVCQHSKIKWCTSKTLKRQRI